jgi:hypothetical protein
MGDNRAVALVIASRNLIENFVSIQVVYYWSLSENFCFTWR